MSNAISLSSLIPAGLSVEQFEACEGALILTASARNRQACAPLAHRAQAACIADTFEA